MAARKPHVTRTWWGKEELGVDVYSAALDRVRLAFDLYDDLCVSFSGGKDSTAALNVVLEVARELDRLPVPAIFVDEEAIPPETIEYVERVSKLDEVDLHWLCVPHIHRNACSDEGEGLWSPWAPEAEALWCRPLPEQAITSIDAFGTDTPMDQRPNVPVLISTYTNQILGAGGTRRIGQVLGIRAAESITRRRAVSNRRQENWIIPSTDPPRNVDKVYPVYDWSTADVWTAPAQHGWDTNATYDVLEMLGISHHAQRCAPPFGEEPRTNLWMFRECWPDLWDRISYRVPGADAASRYARTELYSFQERPQKPDELTWEQWLRQIIEDYDDEGMRAFVAYKVRAMIRRHYSKTSEPIMPTARHPETGFSWEFLCHVAQRGDVKDRTQMMEGIGGAHYDKFRAAYDLERAALAADTPTPTSTSASEESP